MGDVVVVSVPFGRYRELPTEGVAGKVVIDTKSWAPALPPERTTAVVDST